MKKTYRDTRLLHRQVRVGRKKKGKSTAIRVTKFRTMKKDAHKDFEGRGRKAEHHLTWLGKILRPKHLDELPQIISVLKGDLRLVGLRPLPKQDYRKLPPELKKIYDEVGPGFLGLQYACKHFPPTTKELIQVSEEFYRMWKKSKILANRTFARRILENFTGKEIHITELES